MSRRLLPAGAKQGLIMTHPDPVPGTSSGSAASVRITGVEIVNESSEAALARLLALLDGPPGATLLFVNAHTLNFAARDAAYRRLLNDAGLVYGDGTGVRWAAACRGVTMLANLNGTDLVPALLARTRGRRCYLLGGTPELIRDAAAALERRFPGWQVAGFHHGYLDPASTDEAIAAINRSGADLLLVGMGNPLQEQWLAGHRSRLRVPLCIGVGGLFAYWAGTLDRAPSWMRRQGIEWLHILRRQPWKLRRYLVGNPLFLLRMLLWLPADLREVRKRAFPAPVLES